MRRFMVAFAMFFTATFARATGFSTDASDLWWISSESGWGVNVIQQDKVLFITLFAYGPDNKPTWYVGPDTEYQSTNSSGGLVYTGSWYTTTTGSYFGASTFDPNSVQPRQVGTVTFTLNTVGTGTLQYTVDGVSVTKQVIRQTWRNNNVAGNYIGAFVGTSTGTTCPSQLAGTKELSATFVVTTGTATPSGTPITIQQTSTGLTCTFNGTYKQEGRYGNASGTASCSNGSTGTFQATEAEASPIGFSARATSLFGANCTSVGRIGGARRAN